MGRSSTSGARLALNIFLGRYACVEQRRPAAPCAHARRRRLWHLVHTLADGGCAPESGCTILGSDVGSSRFLKNGSAQTLRKLVNRSPGVGASRLRGRGRSRCRPWCPALGWALLGLLVAILSRTVGPSWVEVRCI